MSKLASQDQSLLPVRQTIANRLVRVLARRSPGWDGPQPVKPQPHTADALSPEDLRLLTAAAEQHADACAAMLQQLAAHLQAVECTQEADMEQYFDAQGHVLVRLYAELSGAAPSPTRLLQLAAQYALDARRTIDVPSHHIDLRPTETAFEIGIALPGRGLPCDLVPGQIVWNPVARVLLQELQESSPNYFVMRSWIETMLGRVPSQTELATLPVLMPDGTWLPRIRVDVVGSTIELGGIAHPVDPLTIRIIQVLLRKPGCLLSTRHIHNQDPVLEGLRCDRYLAKLPGPLRALIKGKTGSGFQINATA
jgi:hypothetical protein